MLGRTHFVCGVAVGAHLGVITGHPFMGAALGGIGGLMPDIDHPGSILGRALPFISIPISILFPHRTITHTVWFAAAVALLPLLFIALCSYSGLIIRLDYYWAGAYLMAGSLSHLVLDAPTNSGIAPFWPIPLRIKGPFTTGDPLVELPLSAAMVILAVKTPGILG
mgnify:CR=1 FL=1